ncbi:MAG TPA: tRNA (adenosine(37)-N6)-threonylcarbamoyltransferase complex dimerization subunit type 1 TsaB [Vicinamibacterales bacterium]|jgi:tRNA threonylcarbamoyladenosine biosynthesis protein TsaB|nr:tRNA (adenosine(37)-N6)-threonylcarbamoyltransferase complex dimerization subunit type 1 TsaB [Vicinamibacterales bacterium]
MRVLALDTTSRAGSVAIIDGDRVIAEIAGDPAHSHAERLPGDLTQALDANGWRAAEVDAFAVVAGPGSFTGLRIGIATVQGLAFVLGKPIVGVSALEALAQAAAAAAQPGALVGAWVDAHRHEVFSALYRVADAPAFSPERLVELEAPSVGAPAATIDRWRQRGEGLPVLTGDGTATYRSLLESVPVLDIRSLAGAAGRMAAVRATRGEAVAPSDVHPIYVRRPDAEVARERARAAR